MASTLLKSQTKSNVDRRGSYISSQLTVINDKLQMLYDEIGISDDERTIREKNLYAAVSQALEQHVSEVTAEKEDLYKQCLDLREQLLSMMAALQDVPEADEVIGETEKALEISTPLLDTLEGLSKKNKRLQGLYTERYERAHELLDNLRTFSQVMEGIDVRKDLLELQPKSISLTNSNLASLETEVLRLSDEYERRIKVVQADATEIVSLWAQLGTSQHNIDRDILAYYKDKPEMLGLTDKQMDALRKQRESLESEKESRVQRLSVTKSAVQHLWSKLSEEESVVKAFDRANRGIALSVIEAYENELARLNEKKRDHMHIFIQDARQTLRSLWDSLYFSEDEMLEFTPAWTDIFTDASLVAHESEIARLEKLLQERKPILALIDAYRELQRDSLELEQSQQDASRLMARGTGRRDPSRLLREEQMRKRIAKRKPKLMTDLIASLSRWETENERPFMVNGERFIEVLREEEQAAKAPRGRKTPSRSTASTSNPKEEVKTPATRSVKRAPLQSRDIHQLNSVPPKQPNFQAEQKLKGSISNDPFKTSRSRRPNENISPIRGNSSGDSSTCSGNSPLKMRTKAQQRSAQVGLSNSLNSQSTSVATSAQRANLALSVARAKTALGTHSSNKALPPPMSMSTPKPTAKSKQERFPRLDPPSRQTASYLSRSASSKSNASSSYGSSVASNASELRGNTTATLDSLASLRMSTDNEGEIAYFSRIQSEETPRNNSKRRFLPGEVSEFVDDYDDEYEHATASRRLSSVASMTDENNHTITEEINEHAADLSKTIKNQRQSDSDGDEGAMETLLAIDRLALEPPPEPSPMISKSSRFFIDRSGFEDTEISFISPQHMQPLGYDIPYATETPPFVKVLPDRMKLFEDDDSGCF
ncbi:microtubule associated protein-domain-containing protein [Myxozyma melibiosi]|uniref:Microtubule associated protein-domain-containing protein n=1 Tax=Myxozyma melibiosi TaxID=54550 RepID=A0ABR1F3L6_9ASCO